MMWIRYIGWSMPEIRLRKHRGYWVLAINLPLLEFVIVSRKMAQLIYDWHAVDVAETMRRAAREVVVGR